MDKGVIPTRAQEYVAALLRNKVAEPLSEAALKAYCQVVGPL